MKREKCPCCGRMEFLDDEQVQIRNGDVGVGVAVCSPCGRNQDCSVFTEDCHREFCDKCDEDPCICDVIAEEKERLKQEGLRADDAEGR